MYPTKPKKHLCITQKNIANKQNNVYNFAKTCNQKKAKFSPYDHTITKM